ncbi:MAG: hypothetical protein EOO24_10190 [Comamonadaceae bacterium]|nr:MAG: hypothetical protein EOO24_10190 [Comamonadaceae bacterium]
MNRPCLFAPGAAGGRLRRTAVGLALGGGIVLALTACGAPRGHYAAAASASQRASEPPVDAAEAPAGRAGSVDTAATYLQLVERMQWEGLWFASLAHIDALEQRWGPSPASIRLRADAQRQTGQSEAAREGYARLVGTPLEGAGHHGLGLLAGAQGDFALAVQRLRMAVQQSPADALLLSDLGYAQLRAGRIAEARLPLLQAMQLQPDELRIQVNVALYLQASGQAAVAEQLMQERRMGPATRAAVRQVAAELPRSGDSTRSDPGGRPIGIAGDANAAVAGATTVPLVQTTDVVFNALPGARVGAADDAPTAPLRLKPASWLRRVTVEVRPEAVAPPLAAATPPNGTAAATSPMPTTTTAAASADATSRRTDGATP